MHKRNYSDQNGVFVTDVQAAALCNMGRTAVRKYAEECGAAKKLDRSYRIHFPTLEKYLCSFGIDKKEDK